MAARRDNWSHHRVTAWSGTEIGAWRYDGPVDPVLADAWGTEWWIRLRKGARDSLKWCGYCWQPPYRWYQLHLCPPRAWLVLTPPNRWARYKHPRMKRQVLLTGSGRDPDIGQTRGHGLCTHQHHLNDAIEAVETAGEKVIRERILKALASDGRNQ